MSNWCVCGTCDSCQGRNGTLDLRTKKGLGDVYPDGFKKSSWDRTEPLITPEQLIRRHLFGIPLISGFKDPSTGKAQKMTTDDLIDYIDRAVGLAELETGLTIFESKYEANLPWDKQEYTSFGYFRIEQRPVQSIESLTVNLSNDEDIFVVPLSWIDTKMLHKGQLNIIPLTIALTAGGSLAVPTTAGGATMLQILGNRPWIAQFWKLSCTVGFPNNLLPKVINDLIGIIAALGVLSMLASTYARSTSQSLSIDAMSQSQSGPGPGLFKPRIEELEAQRTMLVNKLKTMYGLKLFSGNV
jgi:hypothetical protein